MAAIFTTYSEKKRHILLDFPNCSSIHCFFPIVIILISKNPYSRQMSQNLKLRIYGFLVTNKIAIGKNNESNYYWET